MEPERSVGPGLGVTKLGRGLEGLEAYREIDGPVDLVAVGEAAAGWSSVESKPWLDASRRSLPLPWFLRE